MNQTEIDKAIRAVIRATNHMTRTIDGEEFTGGVYGYHRLIKRLYFTIKCDHGEGAAKAILESVMNGE